MGDVSSETLDDELTDFLVAHIDPDEIIAFKVSEAVDNYLLSLLDKNRNEGLSEEEQDEMKQILFIDHIMVMLLAKARLKLMGEE